jgi:hypothetical protein
MARTVSILADGVLFIKGRFASCGALFLPATIPPLPVHAAREAKRF